MPNKHEGGVRALQNHHYQSSIISCLVSSVRSSKKFLLPLFFDAVKWYAAPNNTARTAFKSQKKTLQLERAHHGRLPFIPQHVPCQVDPLWAANRALSLSRWHHCYAVRRAVLNATFCKCFVAESAWKRTLKKHITHEGQSRAERPDNNISPRI